MSDDKKPIQDEELDQVSGGVSSHPGIPVDPIRPGGTPPTHPGGINNPVRPGRPSNPAGG